MGTPERAVRTGREPLLPRERHLFLWTPFSVCFRRGQPTGGNVHTWSPPVLILTPPKHMCKVRDAIPFGQQVFHTPRAVSLRDGRMSPVYLPRGGLLHRRSSLLLSASVSLPSKSPVRRIIGSRSRTACSLSAGGSFSGDSTSVKKSANGSWLMPVLKKLSSPRKGHCRILARKRRKF